MNLDEQVMSWLADHRSAPLTRCCRDLMWLGTSLPGMALCAVALTVAALLARRPLVALASGGAVLGGAVISIGLKGVFHRARPSEAYALVEAAGYSMPSTAATMSAAALVPLLGLLMSPTARRWGWGVIVAAQAVIVFALLYLGSHWFTDTVAGTVLGGAIGYGALMLVRRRHAGGPMSTS